MSIEAERLIELIEFCQHSARLRVKPIAAVSSHGSFSLYEHELINLLGIKLSLVNHDDEGDEVWLLVDRIQETKPPDITNAWLKPWVQISRSPNEEPKLKNSVEGSELIAGGMHTAKQGHLNFLGIRKYFKTTSTAIHGNTNLHSLVNKEYCVSWGASDFEWL
jgi:hypothetical protein